MREYMARPENNTPEKRAARRATHAAWKAANPDRVRASYEKSRAKFFSLPPDVISAKKAEKTERQRERNKKLGSKRWPSLGFTTEDYQRMLLAQKRGCGICGKPAAYSKDGRLHVDHDHTTGKVRGLLCDKCNLGIGIFQDNVGLLEGAIDYLA